MNKYTSTIVNGMVGACELYYMFYYKKKIKKYIFHYNSNIPIKNCYFF